MPVRTDLSNTARHVQMTLSRATVREYDDHHLMQQMKAADGYHSQTDTDVELIHSPGMTAHALKQDQDDQQKQSKQNGGNGKGDWNHDQPKGKASEIVMLRLGGSQSHPVGLPMTDRRVRPYDLPEGASAFYAVTGTGQMFYHNDAGSYVVAVNNPKYGKDEKEKERFGSLRHVTKKVQPREIKEGSKAEDFKHEGETVNTEVRITSSRIEIYDGSTLVGYYDKSAKKWVIGPGTEAHIGIDGRWINIIGGKVWLGEPSMDSMTGARVSTEAGLSEKVYAVV